MQNEPIEVTLRVTGILEKLGIPYVSGETSERQWRDILGILKTREGELDIEYLRKWAEDLNVTDLLERAFKESA
jgi:hypothetical protein